MGIRDAKATSSTAQASLANLLFCVGIRVGSLRYIPNNPYVFIVCRPVPSP